MKCLVIVFCSLMLHVTSLMADDVPLPALDDAHPAVRNVVEQTHRSVALAGDSADAWGAYAVVLHAHRFLDEADAAYAKASSLAPKEFKWSYFRGVALLETDANNALRYLDRAIELDPRYPPARIRRGVALEAVARDRDALREYQTAIRMQPRNASAHARVGLLYIRLGRMDEALHHLETAVKARPEDAAVLAGLSQVHARNGDTDIAQTFADRASASTPGRLVDDPRFNDVATASVTATGFQDRAAIYFKTGNFEQAQYELEQAIALGHTPAPFHESLARLHYRQAQWASCVEHANAARGLGRTNAELKLIHATALYRLNRVTDAAVVLDELLTEEPAHLPGLRLRGHLKVAAGDDAAAAAVWSHSLELEDHLPTRLNRARAWNRMGESEKAIAELESMRAAYPKSAGALVALGDIYEHNGLHERALEQFDLAARGATNPLPERRAVSMLIALDRFDEAKRRLQVARQKWPANANLINDLAWLLATCPDDSVRDGAQAIRLISPLVRQTDRQEPTVLDTYAAALAAVNRFAEAEAVMKEAMSLTSVQLTDEQRSRYESHRSAYAEGRTWLSD